MELSIADIEGSVYQNFIDYIRNPGTFKNYSADIKKFLNAIPIDIYENNQIPLKDDSIESKAEAFVTLSKKDISVVKSIIKAYVRELIQRSESSDPKNRIGANRINNLIKPIKALCAANEVDISWKLVDKKIPKPGKSEDRAYTREEIQKMMIKATDITDKIIVCMFSSAGFRLEGWNFFIWKDLTFFKNKDGSFKGAALCVYRGDIEQYWTFITPETCKYLMLYRESWKKRFGNYPRYDDPLIVSNRIGLPTRLGYSGVQSRMRELVMSIGLRPPLKNGKRRHKVQLDHGFRKYFNTMCRRAKVNGLDKEDMMGHVNGLEKHYERYEEFDFERFPEYQKAIPFLTISDEERDKLELIQKQQEITELEEKNNKLEDQQKQINEMKVKQEKIEKLIYIEKKFPDINN